MADIFFSYSRKDEHIVVPIVKSLLEQGFSVFYHDFVPAGDNWAEYLEKELDKAKILLVSVSKNSNNSEYVRWETEYFRASSKPIIPIKIDEEKPPLSLRNVQYISLINWNKNKNDTNWMHLIKSIERIYKINYQRFAPEIISSGFENIINYQEALNSEG